MSFMTYQSTRPYAKAIEKAVVARTMPPWFADPAVGHFKNAKMLTDDQIATLSTWAEKGALEGNPKDAPQTAQVLPGNPKIVHHMKAWIRPPDRRG